VEKLLGIEAPKRAQYIRVAMAELQRLAAHLIWLATHALDIGAMTVLFYCFRERESILRIIEEVSGMEGEDVYRMEHSLRSSDPAGLRNSRLNFMRNCMEQGITEKKANLIFDYLEENIPFTYAKSLACSRAYLSYISAYLKARYLNYYYAALLNVFSGQTGKYEQYRRSFEREGGRLLPCDINRSYQSFIAEGDSIRAPLEEESDDGADLIVRERGERGEFKSIDDLLARLPEIKEDRLLNMADSGVLDSLGGTRKEIESRLLDLFEKRKIKMPEGSERERSPEGVDGVSRQLSIFDQDKE
jgi:DNA polymerase III alpha subunit